MPPESKESLIILSDLHLASGIDPHTQKLTRQEDFFSDSAFAHFVDHLLHRAADEHRTWRLLLLGDVFDFLHVPDPSSAEHNHSLAESALEKLDRIAAGHPVFFEALGRFSAAGFPLGVMPGNHDIELLFPLVQQRLVELVARFTSQAALPIHFYPWIYYIPGLLYAEHGQQHHDLNTFPMLLKLAQHESCTTKDLPIGSHFDNYLYALLDRLDPQAECIKPPLAALRRAIRARPIAVLMAVRLHLAFFKVLMRQVTHAGTTKTIRKEPLLESYAAEIGLNTPTLKALNHLSSTSGLSIVKRLLCKSLQKTKPGNGDYLHQAARNIHEILKAADLNVRYYVFGHSHAAGQFPLSGDDTAWYLNSGTWTTLPPEVCPTPSHLQPLTYIEMDCETAAAHLWLWDDTHGQSRLFP